MGKMLKTNDFAGNTASGNEAILECSSGNYCCDANRPDIGCCDTTNRYFTLPDGHVVASISDSSSDDATTTIEIITSSRVSATTILVISTGIISADSSGSSTTSPSSTLTARGPLGDGTRKAQPSTSFILMTSVIVNSAGSSSTIIGSNALVPQAITSPSDPPSAKPAMSKNNLDFKIGLGVGAPLGMIAFAVLIFLLWRRRQKSKNASSTRDSRQAVESRQLDSMYKFTEDTPAVTSTAPTSSEVDQLASNKYSIISNRSDAAAEHRKIPIISGLGLHPISPEQPDSSLQRRSELYGSSSYHVQPLPGSPEHPSELEGNAF